jgi:fimbrial chaperone protein
MAAFPRNLFGIDMPGGAGPGTSGLVPRDQPRRGGILFRHHYRNPHLLSLPVQTPLRIIATWVLACAGGGFCLTGPALAQNFQVSPITIQLQPGQMTTTLVVTNNGTATSGLQIRPFQWNQAAGADQLTPTEDLLASPPITEVNAGAAQTFRLILRRPATNTESSYRVLIDELPPPATPGMIRVALRFSVPIFVEPASRALAAIEWHVVIDAKGAALVGENHGTKHAQILNPVLTQESGQALTVKAGRSSYILPNAENSWRVTGGDQLRPGTILHLIAKSNGAPIAAAVPVVAQ